MANVQCIIEPSSMGDKATRAAGFGRPPGYEVINGARHPVDRLEASCRPVATLRAAFSHTLGPLRTLT